jgi:hypothetical protein
VGLSNRGLKRGEEGVLHVPQHGPSHVPTAAVEALLVDDDVPLDDEAAESVDLVSEHLGLCGLERAACEIVTDVSETVLSIKSKNPSIFYTYRKKRGFYFL